MGTLNILAVCGTFDIELHFGIEEVSEVAPIINAIIANHPEIKPRPKFQKRDEFKPGLGVVKETRDDKTKNGKAICIAVVTMNDGGEIECSYLPPRKTWKAGEKVEVVKGDYGPALKEVIEDEDPPF